jgi:hypothetical protein
VAALNKCTQRKPWLYSQLCTTAPSQTLLVTFLFDRVDVLLLGRKAAPLVSKFVNTFPGQTKGKVTSQDNLLVSKALES